MVRHVVSHQVQVPVVDLDSVMREHAMNFVYETVPRSLDTVELADAVWIVAAELVDVQLAES